MLIVCTEGSPATEGCFSQRSAQPCSHSQHTNHALARTARLGLCLDRPSVQKPWKKERKKHSAASFGDEQAQLHRVGHPSHCSFLPQVVQLPGEATSHPRPLHPAPASTEKTTNSCCCCCWCRNQPANVQRRFPRLTAVWRRCRPSRPRTLGSLPAGWPLFRAGRQRSEGWRRAGGPSDRAGRWGAGPGWGLGAGAGSAGCRRPGGRRSPRGGSCPPRSRCPTPPPPPRRPTGSWSRAPRSPPGRAGMAEGTGGASVSPGDALAAAAVARMRARAAPPRTTEELWGRGPAGEEGNEARATDDGWLGERRKAGEAGEGAAGAGGTSQPRRVEKATTGGGQTTRREGAPGTGPGRPESPSSPCPPCGPERPPRLPRSPCPRAAPSGCWAPGTAGGRR